MLVRDCLLTTYTYTSHFASAIQTVFLVLIFKTAVPLIPEAALRIGDFVADAISKEETVGTARRSLIVAIVIDIAIDVQALQSNNLYRPSIFSQSK